MSSGVVERVVEKSLAVKRFLESSRDAVISPYVAQIGLLVQTVGAVLWLSGPLSFVPFFVLFNVGTLWNAAPTVWGADRVPVVGFILLAVLAMADGGLLAFYGAGRIS